MPRIESAFPAYPRPLRELLGPLATSAQGMGKQQEFLRVIAANLANAETTRTPEGGPYRRQIAIAGGSNAPSGIEVVQDPSRGRLVYDPGHPDANADGFVEYPNVDIQSELVDLMLARRLFEANASVFQAAKSMLRSSLDI